MIKIFVGPMFSSKSHQLIKYMGEDSVAYIPKIDTRSNSTITSRTGSSIPAMPISTHLDFDISFITHSVIVIDEVQFLNSSIIDYIIKNKNKKFWVLAGLDYDYQQKPFENTQRLINESQEVVHLCATCEICKNDNAVHTCRRSGISSERIVVGSDQYYPLCDSCLQQYGNESL